MEARMPSKGEARGTSHWAQVREGRASPRRPASQETYRCMVALALGPGIGPGTVFRLSDEAAQGRIGARGGLASSSVVHWPRVRRPWAHVA
ncbi:hypothetical protein FHS54_002294 [Sphingobium vermicomposti]|uniref:Uncharacterized protein n=1 Tax=Sphingobium vermicomposti TaxID=529005 RepID=A0A846MGG5_9SPHN|nr:hypothetical protein [Sphingobium vermicomposti]